MEKVIFKTQNEKDAEEVKVNPQVNSNPEDNADVKVNANAEINTGDTYKASDKATLTEADFRQFDDLANKSGKIFKAAKSDQSSSNPTTIAELDNRMVAKLSEAGYTDLASKIQAQSPKHLPSNKKSFWVRALPFIGVSTMMATFALVGVVTGLFDNLFGTNVNTKSLTQMSQDPVAPQISFRAEKYTNSGYVAQENSFVLEVDGEMVSSVESSIKIEPEIPYEIETTSNGKMEIKITPEENLEIGQQYSVTIAQGTEFANDSELKKDLTWVFTVEPTFALRGTTPADQATKVPINTAIEFEFNHINISETELKKYLTIAPKTDGKFEKHGMKIVFLPNAPLSPDTNYILTVSKDFKNLEGESLPQDYIVKFKTLFVQSESVNNDFYVESLYTGLIAESVTEKIVEYISPYSEMNLRVNTYELDVESIITELVNNRGDVTQLPEKSKLINTKTFSYTPTDGDNAGVTYEYKPTKRGVYLVEFVNETKKKSEKQYHIVSYTNIGVISHVTSDLTRGWIFDMASEKLDNQGDIKCYDYDYGTNSTDIKTNNDGTFRVEGKACSLVYVTKGNDKALAVNNSGYSTYKYYGSPDNLTTYTGKTIFDKPGYKPGDELYFKTIIRKFQSNDLAVPEGSKVRVTISNSDWYSADYGNRVIMPLFEKDYVLSNGYGFVEDSLKIPSSQPVGGYLLTVSIIGDNGKVQDIVSSEYFEVTNIEISKYRYEITVDKQYLMKGETVNITVKGTDYSDQPLANKRVKIEIGVDKDALNSSYNDIESLNIDANDGYYYESVVLSREVTLDSEGKYSFGYNPIFDSSYANVSWFVVDVSDLTSNTVQDSLPFMYAQTRQEPLGYRLFDRNIGESAESKLRVFNLWSANGASNYSFSAEIRRTWQYIVTSTPVYDENNKIVHYYDEYATGDETVSTNTYKTDNDGYFTIKLENLKEGTYYTNLTYNGITRKIYLGYVNEYSNDYFNSFVARIDFAEDEYNVGDTAKANISTKASLNGMYIASSGDYFEWEMLKTNTDKKPVSKSIKITEQMYPKLEACFVAISNKFYGSEDERDAYFNRGYKTGKVLTGNCATIIVNSDIGIIDTEVSTDKQTYKPGEKVKVSIQTKDSKGNPVQSSVALRGVDQAYIDAFGQSGLESELLRDSLYMAGLDRQYLFVSVVSPFEMGGMGDAGGDGSFDIRKNIKDLAFWNGNIETDSSGNGYVEFALPDNMTTWNITAISNDKRGGIGAGTTRVNTKLDTKVDIAAPSFLRNEDKFAPIVEIANFSESFEAEVRAICKGCVEENWNRKLAVNKNDRVNVEPMLEVKSDAKNVELTISVYKCSGNTCNTGLDGLQKNIPIFKVGSIVTDVKSGVVKDGVNEYSLEVDLGDEYRKDLNSVEIYVSKLIGGDEVSYPSDPYIKSTILLSDSILMNSLIYTNYDKINPAMDKQELFDLISTQYDKLIANQMKDGGFSWFGHDAVSTDTSSYAAAALKAVSEAGIYVNPSVVGNLVGYFSQVIQSDQSSLYEKIDAVRGLSYIDRTSALVWVNQIRTAYLSDEALEVRKSPLATAYLIQAYNNLGSTGDSAELVKYLRETVKESERGAYWEDNSSNFKIEASSDYTTAMAYLAISPLEQWDIKYKVRNWLTQRSVTDYDKNYEYQKIMYALAYSDRENLINRQKASSIKVYVNGQESKSFEITADQTSKYSFYVSSDELRAGKNEIKFVRTGEGDLYLLARSDRVDTSPFASGSNNSEVDTVKTNAGSFKVVKRYFDLYTGKEINSKDFKVGQLVRVRLEVKTDKTQSNVIIRDQYAAGAKPIDLSRRSVPPSAEIEYYKNTVPTVDRWGTINSDFVSFGKYSMEKDKGYAFEYLLLVSNQGVYDAGSTSIFVANFPDVGNRYMNSEAVVSGK